MKYVWRLLNFIKDINNYLEYIAENESNFFIYLPRFSIKFLYLDNDKFSDTYTLSCNKDTLDIKWKKNKKKAKVGIFYDLLTKKSIFLNPPFSLNYVEDQTTITSLFKNKQKYLLVFNYVKKYLNNIIDIAEKIDHINFSELEQSFLEFYKDIKQEINTPKNDNEFLLLLDDIILLYNDLDYKLYRIISPDLVMNILITIEYEDDYCKDYKFLKEHKLELITTDITKKFIKYMPTDKFGYLKSQFSHHVPIVEDDKCMGYITIQFIYNNLLELLLFIDFVKTLKYV